MRLVDSHCHLDDPQFNSDRDAAVQRALDAGVERMLAIGTGEGPPDLEAALRLADKYPAMLASAGIHPQYAGNAADSDYKQLAALLRHPKCVAVGEIGLDYHWEPYDKAVQARVFLQQMTIAREAAKPVVVHTRDAWPDTVALLREHWAPTGLPCIMHCFTGTPEQAREVLDLGFYISFAGVVTYPKALDVQASAKMVPLDRLLVETDAPYLAPVPFRGKRNEPSYVAHTARFIAKLRGIGENEVADASRANFEAIAPVRYTEGFE
jgi:TatD DNase family protein